MYKNIEIRKLPSGLLCNLINILEINSDWKKFMSNIPKDINIITSTNFEPKYNSEDIYMIEEYAKESSQKCTEILLDEWATSGRVRPTLRDLKMIIDRSQVLYRAADELADILKESKPQRPSDGPAAPITTDVSILLNESKLNTDNTNMQRFCGQSTEQMKSADPLIQSNVPMSSTDCFGNKITVEMKSATDLIEFSTNKIGNNISSQSTKPLEMSGNVPDFKALAQEPSNLNYLNVYQQSFPNLDISIDIDSAILQDTKLRDFHYQELQSITNNFSDNLVEGPNGFKAGKIGSGGFGDVFVGTYPNFGLLAVKKVHSNLDIKRKPDIAMKVFNAEVKFLSHFRHTNILPILGYSIDGPVPCIVSEYIDGGSLSEKIEAKVLNIEHRMNIILGTAEGLKYLHTNETPIQSNADLLNLGRAVVSDSDHSTTNFVHGDVKSANILLTKDCVPKLCDFGLAKQYDFTIMTTCLMGTTAYMAPEGLHGTITQKIDIYSFGIVLLEILTGLKPIVLSNGETLNIKDYVEENYKGEIKSLLDSEVQNWIEASNIYKLAQLCLERNRKDRPTMNEVCKTLYEIWDS